MNIGKNIKELRARKNFTQKDLAEKLNVTPQAVSRWELDTVEPSIDTLKDMANLFDVSMDQLMSDSLDLNKEEKVEEEKTTQNEPIQEVKEEVAPSVSFGKCEFCGKEIKQGEGELLFKSDGTAYYECNDCLKKLGNAKDIAYRKFRKRAWIVSILVGVLVLALFLGLGLWAGDGQKALEIVGVSILAGVLSYMMVFCIMMQNNYVGDTWLSIAKFGCIRLPGIIFTLDLNGVFFLIFVKFLGLILSGIITIVSLIFATFMAIVTSIFVFPFSMYWAYKNPDKSEFVY